VQQDNSVAPAGRKLNPLRVLTAEELRHRRSVKWNRYPADVLPLWVAEMDVLPAGPVIDAVRQAMERGETGYSSTGSEYAEALAQFAAERWGWEVHPERGRIANGVLMGLYEVLRAITRPGDGVVLNTPGYGPQFEFAEHLGCTVIEAPLGADQRIDIEALRAAFESSGGVRPRVYILTNPHNPTGTVHTAAELAAVADLAGAYGVRVISNEIAAPIVLPGAKHVPYLSIPGTDNAFAIFSASKAWNLSGLKAAVTMGGSESAADLLRIPLDMVYGLSHVGVTANVAALRHAGEWLDDLLLALGENRRLLADLARRYLPGIHVRLPEGTYLAWLDCRDLPQLGDDPAAVFLDRARVALSSGNEFRTGGAGHARLNFATSPEILTEAVQRMATVVSPAAAPSS
jgi:cysteine-S-conjugate beta-lyase